jgi:phosphomannomutase
MNNIDQTIFKAYDIRGIYPAQIDEEVAYKIGQAYAKFINPKTVALGRDVRLSGLSLFESAKQGLVDAGVNVVDIGVISTDMLYFAVAEYGFDGGITISASHNPKEYNGFKLVRTGAQPISGDTGIMDIRDLVLSGYSQKSKAPGNVQTKDIRADYIKKCLSLIDLGKIKKFKVVANAMFGPALVNVVKMNLPIDLIQVNEQPDGNFPKGQPDPLQEQNRIETEDLIRTEKPDFGVAWDADADRFFLWDENARFIPGYYITAFLGEYFVRKNSGAKVVYDPRLTWATIDRVKSAGGVPLVNKAGHSFIKERMRQEDATFAGEMSGHFYFKDFFYADNGLIPFLLILEIMTEKNKKTSELFDEYFSQYHISGEINTKLPTQDMVKAILDQIENKFSDAKIEKIDGLSVEYAEWRANIRGSNTEPVIRLNVEAKSEELMKQKTQELLDLIRK